MKKLVYSVFCYAVSLTGFAQSWDLQEYEFNGLFETDSALFSVIQDSWGISYDNGVTWSYNSLNIQEDFTPVWIGFFNENYGLVGLRSGTENSVIKTVDGGKNWMSDESGFTPQYWSDEIYHISDGTFIIKASQGSTNDITFDYGETWEKVSLPTSGNTYLPELNVFENTVYYRTGSDIHKSTNGAQSWSSIYSRSSDDMITFSFIDENTGYLITGNCCDESNHQLHKTIDGGLSWSTVETDLSGNITALIFTSESKGFVVENETGWIKESNDGGKTWIKNTPFNSEPYLVLRTNQSAYIFGRDAFKFNPNGSALGLNSNKSTIYPNPTTAWVKLDFKYENYKIIDLSGRVIAMGAYSKNGINVSSLQSGEYLLIITIGEKVEAARFIKTE
ncbi:Por secretion system C-terminal sorting domain-containing protein [Ekhidna lutea]|uniref:Por secretion system C-terminal sorting domain-containing protein n=1 Tax=Ekhidna lutea TaxID=447679 RepID=A0A239H7P2_EKHLU|nr:T9SS type A sorting domain-containing protein [Ekhidna lutea]SNS77058.1 Por secretion system C-terminal sorting domain-containing protein [Ekhidna lutea]